VHTLIRDVNVLVPWNLIHPETCILVHLDTLSPLLQFPATEYIIFAYLVMKFKHVEFIFCSLVYFYVKAYQTWRPLIHIVNFILIIYILRMHLKTWGNLINTYVWKLSFYLFLCYNLLNALIKPNLTKCEMTLKKWRKHVSFLVNTKQLRFVAFTKGRFLYKLFRFY